MEPSQLIGGTEECNSSESGWTMYIASPMHDVALTAADDEGDSDDGDGGEDSDRDSDDEGCGNDDDNDSDDSMASDASSGKNHREHLCKNADGNGNRSSEQHSEQEKDDGVGGMRFGCPNKEENCREVKGMRDADQGSMKGEKEKKFSHVRSTAKARKIDSKEKRK
ncbi:hypothetical protein ACLOJK_031116 [Asimina triloba]